MNTRHNTGFSDNRFAAAGAEYIRAGSSAVTFCALVSPVQTSSCSIGDFVLVVIHQKFLFLVIKALGVEIHHNLRAGLRGADIVMILRVQNKRMSVYFY